MSGKNGKFALMKIRPDNFELMRRWFAVVVPEVFPAALLLPEVNPIAKLDALAARSPAKARAGLSMAIGDLIEATDCWPIKRLSEVDNLLEQRELPSLSEIRVRFSKALRRVVTRGRINNDVEYYAVRNAAEMADQQEASLWNLIATYESQKAG